MKNTEIVRALRWRIGATHSIPRFAGRRSASHVDARLWSLKARARLHRLRIGHRLDSIDTFVQFAGFPRSGHSLIGSIIDAHPLARIAHELDTMGLIKKGFSTEQIFALLDQKALQFTRHGRYWNGYCYQIAGGHHDANGPIRVIGDKKGDGALRWIDQTPALLDTLSARFPVSRKWILVLRNPFDNIASMSLRKGRVYDTIRIQATDDNDFHERLRAAQQNGDIAHEVLDDQIDAYERLCQTVERIQRATPSDAQFRLEHEALAASPRQIIADILAFLHLHPDRDYLDNVVKLIRLAPNQSGELLSWPADKRQRVADIIDRYSFLASYRNNGNRA